MKKINLSLFALFFLLSSPVESQSVEGSITYNRKTDWISIMSALPWMTSEEIDRNRLSWGNMDDNEGQNYDLSFKGDKSVYTYKEEEEGDGSYSWKKAAFVLVRDYNGKKLKDQVEIAGKAFLVEDKIPKYKWKILNELKEIEGYLCMKAETRNELKDQTITVWFTDRIPVSGGPEGYGGLPGAILELNINEDWVVVTATKVDLETPIDKLPIPKKMKGKEVKLEKYNEKLKDFIEDSLEGRRNPYWRIRY